MQSLRTVHRTLLIETKIADIIRGLRDIMLSNELEGDVHDVVDQIIDKDPSVTKFAKRFLIDYNDYVINDPQHQRPYEFNANSLKSLTQEELDHGYRVFRDYVKNAVGEIDVDLILREMIKRISKFEKNQILNAVQDMRELHGYSTFASFVRTLAEYVVSNMSYLYEELRKKLIAFSEDSPNAKDFEIDFLNSIEQYMQNFEQYASGYTDDESYEKYAGMLIDTFKGVGRKTFDALSTMPGGFSMNSTYDVLGAGLSHEETLKKLSHKLSHMYGSLQNVKKHVIEFINYWESNQDIIRAYLNDAPSDEQKTIIAKLIEFARLCAENNDYVDNFNFDNLGWSTLRMIKSLVNDDPQVGEKSFAQIQNFVLDDALKREKENRLTVERVQKAIDEFESQMKGVNVSRDPEFIETMEDLYDSLRAASSAGFNIYDASAADRKKFGPKSSKNGTGFFRMLEAMEGEFSRAPSFKKFTNAMASKGNDTKIDREVAASYVLRLAKLWAEGTEEEQRTFIMGFTDMIKMHLKKAEELDKKLRVDHPPEVKKGAKYRPLDDYAFADARIGKVPRESDNEEEAKLYTAIRKHFVNNIPLSKEYAAQIEKFMEKGAYKKIFHEPKATWLFRGMGASEKYLRKILKLKEDEKIPNTGSKAASFTYTPRGDRGASSWSVDTGTAANFKSEDYMHRIVMQASRARNPNKFVEGPGGLYDVPGFDTYKDEDESIGLGDIKVSKIYWSAYTTKPPGIPKTKKKPEEGAVFNKTKNKTKTKKPAVKKPVIKKKGTTAKPPAKKKATKK